MLDDSKKNGRKQFAKSTKEKVEDAIVEFYLIINEEQIMKFNIRKIQKEMGIRAEYVFENLEGRVHKTAIADCADAVSKKAGVKSKSIHCYRKTLSSMLHSLKLLSGLEVSSMLGHGVEVNAKHGLM